MIIAGARSRALIALSASLVVVAPASATSYEPDSTHVGMNQTQPRASWTLCGSGTYEMAAAGQSIGSETFEITCKPDGTYAGTGRTQITAGPVALDLTTVVELTRDLVPTAASAKGKVGGQPFEQIGTFANGTATMSTNGNSQTIPYTAGASWMGGNIFYPLAFIAARYDEAKGGSQQFAVFPALTATVERATNDAVRGEDGQTISFTRFKFGVAGQEMLLWRDAGGRLAAMAVPAQRLTIARPDVAKLVPALIASPSSTPASSTSPAAGATSTATIDYSAPPGATFTAEEVTVPVTGTSSYTLAGTLLVPKGGNRPHAAVVMVTGSGLQTRDSRIPIPGLEQYAPFRQIAERLASNGVAVLRVDDRGIGGSTGRETLESATTTTLANDTRAQIAWLRARSGIDPNRIIVVGHSEGASIAGILGASDPKLFGLVLMAGVAKRGADVAMEQHEDMLRSDKTLSDSAKTALRAQQKSAMESILAGGDVPGQPVNAWTREYIVYDPLPTIRKVKQPVLILQGEHDRQVDQSHATMLAGALREAGNSRVTVKMFPTLNHLFLPSKTGSFSEYSHLETSVVPVTVLDALSTWITALVGQRM